MSSTFSPMNDQATIPIDYSNILFTLTSLSAITTTATSSALGMLNINPAPAISDKFWKIQILKLGWMLWKTPFLNWGACWKISFQQTILRVSHDEKMIEGIWLIFQSMLTNLKLISPLTKRLTVVHLKRNPTEMLWMLIFVEHQRMYLTKTLIFCLQMQKSKWFSYICRNR